MSGWTTHLPPGSRIAELNAYSGLSNDHQLAGIEGLNPFCKHIKTFVCRRQLQGRARLPKNISSPHYISLRHLKKTGYPVVYASASEGDNNRTSTVRDRHAFLNGTVFPVKEAISNSETQSTYSEGMKKAKGADWLQKGGLVGDGMLYRERFVIRCYEAGTNQRASIDTIANLLQEVACNHVQSLGFSNDGFPTSPIMQKRRLVWVTTRMHIEVDDYPRWGDTVEIDTWFQGEGKVGIMRDWMIKNASSQQVIGRATSTWVMMNQDTRRLSRIADDIKAEWAFPSEHYDSAQKIPKLENAQHVRTGLKPRRGDLDMNQHVNNVTYIGWMLESLPAEILNSLELFSVTLEYRRECKNDDIIDSLTSPEVKQPKDNHSPEISEDNGALLDDGSSSALKTATMTEHLHLLRLAVSGMEINRGRTVWRINPSSCIIPQSK